MQYKTKQAVSDERIFLSTPEAIFSMQLRKGRLNGILRRRISSTLWTDASWQRAHMPRAKERKARLRVGQKRIQNFSSQIRKRCKTKAYVGFQVVDRNEEKSEDEQQKIRKYRDLIIRCLSSSLNPREEIEQRATAGRAFVLWYR